MNERLIREEQSRIDSLDGQKDQIVNDSDHRNYYTQQVFQKVNYLLKYTEILEDNDQSLMQQEILAGLKDIKSENIDELIKDLDDTIDSWISSVEGQVEGYIDDIDEFGLSLDATAKHDYVLKMRNSNVDPNFVYEQMAEIAGIVSSLPTEDFNKCLISILGKLSTGQKENLLSESVLQNVVKYNSENASLLKNDVIDLKNKQRDATQHVEQTRDALIKAVQENNEWFVDNDDEVDQLSQMLEEALRELFLIDRKIEEKNDDLDLLLDSNLMCHFLSLKTLNDIQSLTRFSAGVALKFPFNIPDSIKSYLATCNLKLSGLDQVKILMVQKAILDKEKTSDRDKLTDKIYEILQKRISEREKLAGIGRRGNMADLIHVFSSLYDNTDAASEVFNREQKIMNVVAAKFTDGSFGAKKIEEGYKLVQLHDFKKFGRQKSRQLVNLFLCKKEKDGTFKFIRVAKDGSAFNLSSIDSNVARTIEQEHSLKSGEQERILKEDKEDQTDIEMLVLNDPDIRDYNDFVTGINSKVNNLSKLFNGMIGGGRTKESIDIVRNIAINLGSELRSSNL